MKLFQSSQVHFAPKNIFGFVYILAFMFLGPIDPSEDDPHIGEELNDTYENDEHLNQFIDSLLNFPGEEKQTTSRDAGEELVCSNKNVESIDGGGFQDSEKERVAKSIREGDIECLSDMLDPFINDNESELPDLHGPHIPSPSYGSNTTSVIKTDFPDSGISNDSCSFMGQTSDGLTTWEGSQSVRPQTIPNNEISTSLPKLMHRNLISDDIRPDVNGQRMSKSNSLTPVDHPDGVSIAFRAGSQIAKPKHTSSSLQSRPKPRKRKQVVFGDVPSSTEDRQCLHCGTRSTPQWRSGPKGRKTLCNACGVRHTSGRLLPEYRPRKSPTFKESEHSNSHRRVVQIRKDKNLDDPHDKRLRHQEWLGVTDEELFSTLPLYPYSSNPPCFYYV